MNEQIRELAQAAGLGFHGESITMLQDELPETVLGRFAELIVKECVNTLEFHGFEDAIPYVKWMATNKLGQHFGV